MIVKMRQWQNADFLSCGFIAANPAEETRNAINNDLTSGERRGGGATMHFIFLFQDDEEEGVPFFYFPHAKNVFEGLSQG